MTSSGCIMRLDPWQEAVVTRASSACRDKFGLLLFHRMGAGKTLSLLSIFHNVPVEIRRVIFVPRSIMHTFGADGDIQLLYSDPAELRRRAAQLEVHPLTGDAVDGRRSLESLLTDADPAAFEAVCKDAIIGIDEVHNVVPIIRNRCGGDAFLTLRQGLSGARRLIAMSGTPIVRDISDISVVLSLVDPDTDYPVADGVFKNVYFMATEESKAEARRDVLDVMKRLKTSSIIGGKLSDFSIVGVGSLLGSLVWPPASMAALAVMAGQAIGGFAAYTTFIENMNNYVQTLMASVKSREYIDLNRAQLAGDFARHISYFDYETPVPGTTRQPRYKFPRKQQVEVQASYTRFQLDLLLRMSAGDYRFTQQDMALLGMHPTEDITQQEVFERYAARISDVSPDCLEYNIKISDPRPSKDGPSPLALFEARKHGRPAPPGVFRCPKYLDALKIILRYHERSDPHLMNADVAPLTMMERLRGVERSSVQTVDMLQAFTGDGPGIHHQTPVVRTDQDTKRQVLEVSPREDNDRRRRYLPIVYCSYEKTMKEFSAFLTSLDLPHYVLLGDDTPARRTAMVDRVAIQTYPIAPVDKPRRGKKKRGRRDPVCAILHPSIIEGLSLTYNPCLIALDTIPGYGVQEQVYGRVLRGLKVAPDAVTEDSQRIVKFIYQFRGGYHRPSESEWNSWLGGIPSKRLQGILEDTRDSDGARREVRASDYEATRDAIRVERYRMYNTYEGEGWGAAAKNALGRRIAGVTEFFTREFEATRWRQVAPSPEMLMMQRNEQQASVLETLTDTFKERGDAAMSDECAAERDAPVCRPCIAAPCECASPTWEGLAGAEGACAVAPLPPVARRRRRASGRASKRA